MCTKKSSPYLRKVVKERNSTHTVQKVLNIFNILNSIIQYYHMVLIKNTNYIPFSLTLVSICLKIDKTVKIHKSEQFNIIKKVYFILQY